MATLHLLKMDPTTVVAYSGMVEFIKRCQANVLPCMNTCAAVSLSFVAANAVPIGHAQTLNWPVRGGCRDHAS